MPRISEFFGIVISRYWEERSDQEPHFHANHGDDAASVFFDGSIVVGSLSARDSRLVREWAVLHQAELRRNWELARNAKPLESLAPLA
jgi:hypothetical protein